MRICVAEAALDPRNQTLMYLETDMFYDVIFPYFFLILSRNVSKLPLFFIVLVQFCLDRPAFIES